jgi:hypothetical protein
LRPPAQPASWLGSRPARFAPATLSCHVPERVRHHPGDRRHIGLPRRLPDRWTPILECGTPQTPGGTVPTGPHRYPGHRGRQQSTVARQSGVIECGSRVCDGWRRHDPAPQGPSLSTRDGPGRFVPRCGRLVSPSGRNRGYVVVEGHFKRFTSPQTTTNPTPPPRRSPERPNPTPEGASAQQTPPSVSPSSRRPGRSRTTGVKEDPQKDPPTKTSRAGCDTDPPNQAGSYTGSP